MMRLDPSKPLTEQILRATGRKPAGAEPRKPAHPSAGEGAASPLAPLLEGAMNRAILRAAGRLPRW